MKAALVLSALILFAALMGCSENAALLEPQGWNHTNQVSQQKVPQLMWEKEQLTVRATNEYIAENKCAFENTESSDIPEYYGIEFDVSTNADRLTNGYFPVVEVSKDDGTLFVSSAFPDETGDEISHVSLRLDNTSFSQIKFYIALMQGDIVPVNKVPETSLTLWNISVFRIH